MGACMTLHSCPIYHEHFILYKKNYTKVEARSDEGRMVLKFELKKMDESHFKYLKYTLISNFSSIEVIEHKYFILKSPLT